ncbi:MAG TPA: hypothetical protein VMM13_07350, partial [Euzebya sp.]|nr:hypothetical protein [Euzebya sp.]
MRRSLIILVLIATSATACGGADDTADTTADDVAEEVGDAVDDVAETAGDAAAGIDSAACTEAAEALTAVPAAIGTALSGQGDLAETSAQAQALADLADDVPEQYQADFQVIADTYSEVASTLEGITLEPGTVPDAETQAALTELSTSLSDGAFVTASTNVTAYF